MRTLLLIITLMTATVCSAQGIDTLRLARDTTFTYTITPLEIVVLVDTTTPSKNGYQKAVKDSQGVAAREYSRGVLAGQASGYSSGYSVGYADGFAARPSKEVHDTTIVTVYMIPTDSLVYVNTSGALPSAGFVLPKGSQITSRTYNSTGKTVTLSYIYPKYKIP